MELMPSVHVIETHANSALLTEDRLILVDASADAGARDILGYLEKIGYKPSDVAHIILTHTHPDHVGGLATLKERTEAEVASHRIEAQYIAKETEYPGRGVLRHRACLVDVQLEDGDRYQELLVIHTPGHTPGNIALLDEAKSLLIGGDTMQTREGYIGPMSDDYNIDPQQHRHSMRKVADHEFEALIVGHGAPIATGASDELRRIVASL